jgi:hypothetical protein
MKSKIVSLNEVLEETEHLDLDDREYLLDILSKRLVELKRQMLSHRIKEAEKAYKAGKVKTGKLDDLWKDLNNSETDSSRSIKS